MKTLLKVTLLIALLSCNERKTSSNQNSKMSIMADKNFTTSITVDKDISSTFNSIKNFRGWWSQDIEGNTDRLNDTFFYHYKDVHLSKIKLIEMVADKKLVYQVIANQFNFTKDKTEWVNTKLIFDLTTEGDKTKVVFTHEGLVPEYECYNVCHDAWTSYIHGSLKNFIETGKGKPNGKEGGLNAELVEKWGLPNK
jgi:Activator of Hsp90 ATPase homolog 1-like protein